MRKLFAVLKREYLSAVRKKMFIFMTLFFPVLMTGVMLVPTLLISHGLGEKNVAVIDGTGQLHDAFANTASAVPKKAGRRELPSNLRVRWIDASGDDVSQAAKPYLGRLRSENADKLDSVLVIPADVFNGETAKMTFYSRAATDLITQQELASVANRAIYRRRLVEHGIDPSALDPLTRTVPVDAVQLSRSGEEKKGGEMNFLLGFIFAALLIIPSLVYGLEIMRGIIQEKSDRVVEILISSMSPRELLTGKITGIALVGLTQVSVWIIVGLGMATFFGASAQMAGFNLMQFLRPMVFVYFAVFFLLAYFTFVCIYAIGGSVCNSEKEAQQLIAPISMFMMVPWFLMFAIITNPDSALSVGFSLAPIFGPITMFVRTLVSEPPVWHIVVSIAVSIATILVFFWVTAKIFRTGILSYGKRPTIPELWRWLKVA
ncbi:MAG TPA: ABC transporter permease [Thermoanaerobaculia bacterium]|nr:ABC transporter permease [Thermoanaerobaculia bacterium]